MPGVSSTVLDVSGLVLSLNLFHVPEAKNTLSPRAWDLTKWPRSCAIIPLQIGAVVWVMGWALTAFGVRAQFRLYCRPSSSFRRGFGGLGSRVTGCCGRTQVLVELASEWKSFGKPGKPGRRAHMCYQFVAGHNVLFVSVSHVARGLESLCRSANSLLSCLGPARRL